MNTVALLIIVAVVSCGLIVVLTNRGLCAVGSSWNRNCLSRFERRAGEDLINNPLIFHTAADLDTVAAKIIAEISPCRQDGSLSELYLTAAEPTGGDSSSFVLLYCAGGRERKIMETAVLLRSSGIGTAGSVGMETWQAVDGVIDTVAVHTAKSVREGVRRAVARLDPTAEFSERDFGW